MERLVVRPGAAAEGTVSVSGAKNSVLKLMAATVLAPGEYRIDNVPDITDVRLMADVLVAMGMKAELVGSTLSIVRPTDIVPEAPYELVERMRASIVVLGPLLAATGEARVALPGGDDFGQRPIDLHLAGLERLGAVFEQRHGLIIGRAERLHGARVVLEFPSVGATENLLMASVLAEGTTVVDNAAREPEIADLAAFLNRMGANVLGAGSSTIEIRGVERLQPVESHVVIADRLEVATFLSVVGMAGGEIVIKGARPDHLDMVIQKLGEMGMRISPESGGLWASSKGRLRSVDVASLPYPGIPTDCVPLFVALGSRAEGVGVVTENVFNAGRWRYVAELQRMGADIRTEGHHAVVRGVDHLSAAPVHMPDIRAGAALVVAALGADGEVQLSGVDHIDRGYEHFVDKLSSLGVGIERVDDE